METSTQTSMPTSFTAGTTLSYLRSLSDYPPDSGELTVYLAGAGVAQSVAIAEGGAHRVTFSAAVTAKLPAGTYRFIERYVHEDGTVVDVTSGQVLVEPDLAQAADGDHVSWMEKTLPIVEAAIAGRLPTGLENYSIGGHAVSKIPLQELMNIRNRLASSINMAKTGKISRQHYITFGND